MKKKKLFLFMALTSTIAGLTSCNVSNDNNSTNIVEQTTTTEVISTTSTSSQAPVYNLEDNELSQKVFNEIKKSLPNITYDEFLLYGSKIDAYSGYIKFKYPSIDINIALDGTLISKYEYTNDEKGNLLTSTNSKYENNAWVYIDKYEYTYDESETQKNDTYSVYENNAWVYTYKYEYTYDEKGYRQGNLLTFTDSKYENNAWVYNYKKEYTYDESGNRLTETYSEYVNSEWIKTDESIYINGESKIIWLLFLNPDGTFNQKEEYTYDVNGNTLTLTNSKYENNAWVYSSKYEYTYDESGKQLTETYYEYIDGNWVLQN